MYIIYIYTDTGGKFESNSDETTKYVFYENCESEGSYIILVIIFKYIFKFEQSKVNL